MNYLSFTAIYCYFNFLIVTIQHLNQSFEAVSRSSNVDKYAFAICILAAVILNIFDQNSIYRNKCYKILSLFVYFINVHEFDKNS